MSRLDPRHALVKVLACNPVGLFSGASLELITNNGDSSVAPRRRGQEGGIPFEFAGRLMDANYVV